MGVLYWAPSRTSLSISLKCLLRIRATRHTLGNINKDKDKVKEMEKDNDKEEEKEEKRRRSTRIKIMMNIKRR